MRHFRGWLGYKDIFINLAMFNVYFLQKAAIGGGGAVLWGGGGGGGGVISEFYVFLNGLY